MIETRRGFLKIAAGSLTLPVSVQAGHDPSRQSTVDRLSELRAPQNGEAVLACAGDWFLTRRLSTSVGIESDAVFQVMRRADAGFANLENGLSTVGSGDLGGFRQGSPLRGDPALASDLAWGGIRAVSLANNHTGNYGREALLQTIATLDKANIAHAGAGANIDQAFSPAVVKAGDLTIAFFSVYSLYYGFAANDQATAAEPGVAVCRAFDVIVQPQVGFDSTNFSASPYLLALQNPCSQTILGAVRGDVDRLTAAVKSASSWADFTLLSVHVHWGRHTKHDLPPNLRPFAQELIDAGVDMFVGHGPHAIRGVELYRGKPIVHSMGNFVLMPPSGTARPDLASPGREGLVVRAVVARRAVHSLEILPIAIGEHGNPRFPSNDEAAGTIAKLRGLSAPFGTEIPTKSWFTEIVTA